MKLHQFLTEVPQPHERKEIRQTQWKGPSEIASWLRERKFKRIGSGMYSIAYARPNSDKVVKFSKINDFCYLKFAKFVKDRRSKHLPRIYDLVEYTDKKGEKLFVTVLEKLKPVKFEDINWTRHNKGVLAWLVEEAVIYKVNTRRVQKQIGEIFGFESVDNDDFFDNIKKLSRQFERSNKSFANIYRQLKQKVGKKCIIDIHDGNVYYRKSTNSFVFLDPYA
jgi:hypothetical protein